MEDDFQTNNHPYSNNAENQLKVKASPPRRTKKQLTMLILVAFFSILVLLSPFVLSIATYEGIFGNRIASPFWVFTVDDFEDIERESIAFTSGKNTLQGYIYSSKTSMPTKGLISFSHGFGVTGHSDYLPEINYFCSHGYKVFTYDATGNDESGGNDTNGLPQGAIDLNNALTHIKTIPSINELPLFLYGHSWGGYSVMMQGNFGHEVNAIAERSGFFSSQEMLKTYAKQYVGILGTYIAPCLFAYDFAKFNKLSAYNAGEGLIKSNANILLMHSIDDPTVPYRNYELTYGKIKDVCNVETNIFEDRGHDIIFTPSQREKYYSAKNLAREAISKWGTAENIPPEEKEMLRLNVQTEQRQIDEDLLQSILIFFDKNL